MSKVIIFSRTFPTYHIRKNQSTYFVEKLWSGLNELKLEVPKNKQFDKDFMWSIIPLSNFKPKFHTIRAGHRWKVGDKFSPRCWSGKPYASKQIILAPDIEVKKVFDINIIDTFVYIDYCNIGSLLGTRPKINKLAMNDGLNVYDLFSWFNDSPEYRKEFRFEGQIICWNENISYI